MRSEAFVICVVLIICSIRSSAQKIDNTAFYRDNTSGKSFRIHYENDFFSSSDRYYTQGINVEIYNPQLKNSFVRGMLVRLPNAEINYGIAAEHLGFTPTSMSSIAILYNDRPFAACLMGKLFSVSTDSTRKVQLSSTFSLGIIGPGAGGKQFQSAIHRWINDRQPKGWDNQISNDVILNYNVSVMQGVVDLNYLLIGINAAANVGTLSTNLKGGFLVMAGIFENRWVKDPMKRKKFQVYVYDEPVASLIGFDATLQGGIFNRRSSYTIASRDISRAVFQNNSGIVFVIGKVQLEYFQSLLTKEFSTGQLHRWGGIRIGMML